MRKSRQSQFEKKGSAIVLVVFAVVILSAMGVGLIRLGLHSRLFAVRTASEIVARCAADAGLIKAVFQMNAKLQTKPVDYSSLPLATDEELPNCDATYSYQIAAQSGVGGSAFEIESVGNCVQAEKRVYASIGLEGLFNYAILTKEGLILKSDTLVDGYNSVDPSDTEVEVLIATISTLPDQIELKSGSVIDGQVIVGVDGDPATVIKDLGATTGDKYSMLEEPPFPTIVPPALVDKGTGISVKNATQTIGPTESGIYRSITLKKGTLEVSGGDVVLHVTGDILLGQGCEVIVKDGASLTLYVDGDITCGNDSSISNENFHAPKALQLYATGTGVQDFDIKAKSDWCGVVYAPEAHIDFYAKGDGYGSIVGNDFEFKAGGDFYYDKALRKVTTDDVGVRFVVKTWYED